MKINHDHRASLSPQAVIKLRAWIRRLHRRLDPAYASARPWDWKICQGCRQLVGREETHCPACGGQNFNVSPLAVFRQGLRLYGVPPSLFD